MFKVYNKFSFRGMFTPCLIAPAVLSPSLCFAKRSSGEQNESAGASFGVNFVRNKPKVRQN